MTDKVLDPDNLSGRMVEFWASSVDALLQEFIAAVLDGDRMKVVLAGARVAQLAASMADWFKEGTVGLVITKKEMGDAQAACAQVAKMASGQLNRIYKLKVDADEEPKLTAKPDRALN